MKWSGAGPVRFPSLALVSSIVLATAGVSTAQHLGLVDLVSEDAQVHVQQDPPAGESCPAEEIEEELEEEFLEPASEGEEGCPEDQDGGGESGETEDDLQAFTARDEDCREAAGIDEEGEDGGDGGTLAGLDRAIEAVLANCVKNPDAPGLLVALEKLSANKAKQEVRAEARAAKRAAKAEARGQGGPTVSSDAKGVGTAQGGSASAGRGHGKGEGKAKGRS